MHETPVIADLLGTVNHLAAEHHARRVVRIGLVMGALVPASPDHLREHFLLAAAGTLAEGARLDIRLLPDPADPQAQSIRLESVEIEDAE